jgi:tight adherence protein C
VTLAAALAGLATALAVAGVALALGNAGQRGEARLLRLLGNAGARLNATPPRDLVARIAAAGGPAGLGARELMAAKVGAAVVGSALGLAAASAVGGRAGLVLLVGAPVAGFLSPDAWLARRAAARAEAIRRQLPAMLELLRVTIESGSSLAEALAEVGRGTHGPLSREWRSVGRQVAVGVPLDQALAAMAQRAPLPETQAFVAALERARRHGAPVADTLAGQAHDARFARITHAREQAARAAPKIQLVVALLLVPSVLLLVAAALLAALLAPGDPGGQLLPI